MEVSTEIQNWIDQGNVITVGATYYNNKQKKEEKIRALKKELSGNKVTKGCNTIDSESVTSYTYVSNFPALFINVVVSTWNYKKLEELVVGWQNPTKEYKNSPILAYLLGTALLKLKRNKV